MRYTLITDPAHAGFALNDIAPVYEAVFAEPPYLEGPRDLALFLETYQYEHKTPGFRLVLARTGEGELTGFAYGLPLGSTTGWWDSFLDATPAAEFTREDGQRTFVIKELAVLADQRGQGIGTQLHADLLDGLSAERATLTVRPEAPAAAWYERHGYELVGHTRPWDGAPVYRTLVKALPA
ncbi:GNAT family N-acetyltransferase [Streptomyces sp. NPDC085524]|uniref:GNAT family N-acetyltransferase n=1 Tax=unclassified Streptomyces TaxID=2593676 RepID=UPI0035E28C28